MLGGENKEKHTTIEEWRRRQVAGQNYTTIKQFAEDQVDGDGKEWGGLHCGWSQHDEMMLRHLWCRLWHINCSLPLEILRRLYWIPFLPRFLFPPILATPSPHHDAHRSGVVCTAHLEMKAWPNTLGAPSKHAWEQCPCFLCHMNCRFGNYKT